MHSAALKYSVHVYNFACCWAYVVYSNINNNQTFQTFGTMVQHLKNVLETNKVL